MTTQKRRILLIHHSTDLYGADFGLLHTIASLDRSQFEPLVLLPDDMGDGPLLPELKRLNVDYVYFRLAILRRKYLKPRSASRMVWNLFQAIARLRKLIRDENISLIYVNTAVCISGGIAGKLAKIPVIWHIREIISLPRPARKIMHRIIYTCSSTLVCISKAVRDSFANDEPQVLSKSVVIYNAVPDAESLDPVASQQFKRELGVPENSPLVGLVGRITHWKGQDILAEAAPIVLQQFPHAHFVAVGSVFSDESHYLDALNAKIAELGIGANFHIANYRRDVTTVYGALSILIMASKNPEPFGRVTVEAMMQGVPVIGSNHGGTVELIQPGVNGLLFPPSDSKALAEAICTLLANDNLRVSMGLAAAKFAREHFTMQHYGMAIRKVFNSSLDSFRSASANV